MKLFYSWQSDLDKDITRCFIEEAIQEAIYEIHKNGFPLIEFDKDTKGIPGTPEIAATVLKKINDADIFIADLSYINNVQDKGMPNSNILLEYGFALQCLGDSRIIGVINEFYGSSKNIPFDLKHRHWPISFTLSKDTDEKKKNEIKKKLVNDLKDAIKSIADSGEAYHSRFIEDVTKKIHSFLSTKF